MWVPKAIRKLSTPELTKLVTRNKQWTARCSNRFAKKTTEKDQREYLLGVYQAWLDNAKLKRDFEKKFVQGGLCSPR